ncbi:MAG: AmmeMemoRadiSam system radical SAM enzyme [Desulfitobacterium sp.]|nr:AmmeMemoRadiSam system radical SAM enzyme [Desulfitobacterium sp.]
MVKEIGKASCLLCPRHCQLKVGQTSRCHVRANKGSGVVSLNYGEAASWHTDPIEKKPLYHFYPGKQIFSVAGFGCNLSCTFCQNYEISQVSRQGVPVTPEELAAQASKTLGICFTYSEPTMWYEMIRDTAPLVKESGGKVVLISNGTISSRFLEELIPYIDAVNIDIKGFTEEFYQKYCGGKLSWVLDTVERLAGRVHLEVTTLIVPEGNDDPQEIRELGKWLRNLNTPLAWHLSRYFPSYRHSSPPTDPQKLLELWEIAKEEIEYVYMGNISGGQNTICPQCEKTVIFREYYHTRNILNQGECPYCGRTIFGEGL